MALSTALMVVLSKHSNSNSTTYISIHLWFKLF
ncbi:Uncharacterised protein [Vibrio cholerae]|nr:Uncharacterised protein [Vibrio cholerae]